jgi:SAM-dependent methyltransferase
MNVPSAERLAKFYENYALYRPDWYKSASKFDELAMQYVSYSQFLATLASSRRVKTWLDVGAGHGEIANIMTGLLPETEGFASDLPERPALLSGKVKYMSADLNNPHWNLQFRRRFDLVFAVAVWEHVRSPTQFARAMISLLEPNGILVLICPAYNSPAQRVLGRQWPYYQPGEHLFIPSYAGVEACLKRASASFSSNGMNPVISARPFSVGYSIRYLARVARLQAVSPMLPNISLAMPTGMLCATLDLGNHA